MRTLGLVAFSLALAYSAEASSGSGLLRCAGDPDRLDYQCLLRLASASIHEACHCQHGWDKAAANDTQIACLTLHGGATAQMATVPLARADLLEAQPATAGVVAESAVTAAAAPDIDAPTVTRIRTSSPVIARLIQDATERSPTFHQMVDTISASDGVVYLEQGTCGHGVRACLVLSVTIAGPYRILRVLVDPRKADLDLQGSIGHELWHAIEVLGNPTVRSDGALYYLYDRGSSFQDRSFETIAAIQAGEIVRKELGARRAHARVVSNPTPTGGRDTRLTPAR